MTKGEKLMKFIDYLKMSKNSFAASIGVSSTVINGIVNDSNNAGHKVLTGITQTYPEFNLDWYLNDKGEMIISKEIKSLDRDYLQDYLEKLEEQFKRLLGQLEVKDRQIEKLMDLLGKPEPATVMSREIIAHPATRFAKVV